MKLVKHYTSILLVFLIVYGCNISPQKKTTALTLQSPDKNIGITFEIAERGTLNYSVKYKSSTVIQPSQLGFEFKDWPSFDSGWSIFESEYKKIEEYWEMPWGEQKTVQNKCNELVISLKEDPAPFRSLQLHFRAFNDGIAFRYEIPKTEEADTLIILDEKTHFNFSGNHTCWWIPGDWDIYEHLYSKTKLLEIDALSKRNHSSLAQTYIPENAVSTPVTMKTDESIYLSIHEANLTNYPEMTLKVNQEKPSMQSELVGSDRLGYKAKIPLPFKTPWRTIQIEDKAVDLINSRLLVNLNEANKIGDVSWFKPTKYVGIWWEMHLGKSGWDKDGGKHGATTENAKRFIDFASENNIGAVLIEGWNKGWENWFGDFDREGVFDFITPYDDYNLYEVVEYARNKGVDIIMHHETSAAPRTYDQQMDTAFALMKSLGLTTVKTGYVGKIIPKGEYHHGQWMVNHYRRVLTKAATYQIAINAHEPIKATGIRRTFPNAISREGLRGQEFNAWASDGGNPPEHLSIVAFTRMLAGPIDYTPGIFNIKLDPYKVKNQVNTTLAQQLALYVVIYSPIQMAADLIENYHEAAAFQFIRDVGVDWDTSIALDGEPGDFVTIARKEKHTGNWFLGSITDENQRQIEIEFDFLDKEKKYTAKIYQDGADAHWDHNPGDIRISEQTMDASSIASFQLAPGGGLAISLMIDD